MKGGANYELLTQQVYQVLLDSKWPGKNICVQHDLKLAGTSGQKHQIDVYWEYELAGILNKVAIECKNYNAPLNVGKIRDFYGVLTDLKDVKGIIVAAKGFQKGAKDFARTYGINLKELTVSDEIPIIAEITNHIHISIRKHLYMIDETWANEKGYDLDLYRKRLSLIGNKWQNASYLPIQTTDTIIVDAEGNKLSSIEELDAAFDNQISNEHEHEFTFEEAYINSVSGYIKIMGILITDKEEVQSNTFKLVAEDCVKAILKDALNGKIQNILTMI